MRGTAPMVNQMSDFLTEEFVAQNCQSKRLNEIKVIKWFGTNCNTPDCTSTPQNLELAIACPRQREKRLRTFVHNLGALAALHTFCKDCILLCRKSWSSYLCCIADQLVDAPFASQFGLLLAQLQLSCSGQVFAEGRIFLGNRIQNG